MIESARFKGDGSIFAIIDGQEATIPDDMANRHRHMVAEWEAEGNTIAPYEAQTVTMPPARYSKKLLFEAMTDAEYESFEATEASQPAKDRRVFREATELSEADPGFAKVQQLMNAVYGEDRAAELLAAAEF